MDKLFEESTEGSKIRTNVNYLETCEKPTRLTLHRENQQASSKHINMLTKSGGTEAVSKCARKEEYVNRARQIPDVENV